MVANPERRSAITDAALDVLGASGSRGLTHRAVDVAAGLPTGSTSNFFPSRSSLYLGMVARIFERLAPESSRLAELAALDGEEAVVEYATYAAERLLVNKPLALALVELRLAAARQDDVREALEPFLRQGFDHDCAFHDQRGLPGGRLGVLVLHHLITGIALDALTVPLDPTVPAMDEARHAVMSLFSGPQTLVHRAAHENQRTR